MWWDSLAAKQTADVIAIFNIYLWVYVDDVKFGVGT